MEQDLKSKEISGGLIILMISLLGMLYFWYINVNIFPLNWLLPTSTSLWEGGRLLFVSILIYGIVQYYIFGHDYKNFFFAKTASLFLAPMIFIGGSYLMDLLVGSVFMITHFLMFVIAVSIGQWISYTFLKTGYYFRFMNGYAILGIVVMMMVFFAHLNKTKTYQGPIFKPMSSYQKDILNNFD